MENQSKGNSLSQKILASIIILFMIVVSLLSFINTFSYIYSIDNATMAIILNKSSKPTVEAFFWVFGLLATIGSLVRVTYDFIGHTCYTKEFDFNIWWPWYFFRPLLAFMLGSIFVILFNKDLFGSNVNELPKFPFILSFLTGFSITDAMGFLRMASKRVFGDNNQKNK
jgi:ABC-type multidrug transport system fused ATPase/permease subunit